ncbi:hypothetical protein MASR2M15_09180 [Anaerolineales bacterium]
MNSFRRWQISGESPISMPLAADVRFVKTSYQDDQIWELQLGQEDSAAILLMTTFGGRANFVSLTPMWLINGQTLYEADAYYQAPTISHFAPGMVQLDAAITSELDLQIKIWVIDSQHLGGEFIFTNTGKTEIEIQASLYAHMLKGGAENPLSLITYGAKTGISFGLVENIYPVLALDGPTLAQDPKRAKVSVPIQLQAGKSHQVKWVHSALNSLANSVKSAESWLNTNWEPFYQRMLQLDTAIPQYKTDNESWDLAIALSYMQVVNAFIAPETNKLAYPSFVLQRSKYHGFSRQRNGQDHVRSWSGQDPHASYLITPIIANIESTYAEGIIRNYFTRQKSNGFVGSSPGLAGQNEALHCPPLLAQLSWQIYEINGSKTFLTDLLEPLLNYLKFWLNINKDAAPTWQSEKQLGYLAFPSYSAHHAGANGADIKNFVAPDLISLLICEAIAIKNIAELLKKSAIQTEVTTIIETLSNLLNSLWDDDDASFAYAELHTSRLNQPAQFFLIDAPADQFHSINQELNPPGRLHIMIDGSFRRSPNFSIEIKGLNQNGKPISETVESQNMNLGDSRYSFSSQNLYQKIESIQCHNLIRLFRVSVATIDTSGKNISHLFPLLSPTLTDKQEKALLKTAFDPDQYWRKNGLSMLAATDPQFESQAPDGGGTIWLYWMTQIVEQLIQRSTSLKIEDLIKNLLETQFEVLSTQGAFKQFYASDKTQGYGASGHISGIVPLRLLEAATGVRIINHAQVQVEAKFIWSKKIQINQYGVKVVRNRNGLVIRFPSGFETKLEKITTNQTIIDPNPIKPPPAIQLETPTIQPNTNKRTTIKIQPS